MKTGSLILIPTYLSDSNDLNFISPTVVEYVKEIDFFLVENLRSARRFISSLKAGVVIDDLTFEQLDKNTSWDEMYQLFEPTRSGHDIGLMSEAGLPCLADPGNIAVGFAHQTNINVIPLPGSSSIQLALIASGFNGQQFTFHGYLPIEKSDRVQRVKELEKLATRGYTQLFMETPYRNQVLLETIVKTCRPDTHLSIAYDLTGARQKVLTQPIKKWKNTDIPFHKIPAIFSFGTLS